MTATTIRARVSENKAPHASRPLRQFISGFLACACSLAALGPFAPATATALDIAVSNYSWLQLPSNSVTTFVGSTNNLIGTAFGNTIDPRWGDYVWLPTTTMTNDGNDMYYAGVKLDQARLVESVRVQWWTNGGNTATQYYVDGSNDGSSWTNIANQAIGFGLESGAVTNVAVTPGNYEYVRVRLEGPDYQIGGGYGGPGFMLIEPFGSGTVSGDKVNWANAATFGTTITNTGMPTYNGTSYNDGTLQDRAGMAVWTGTSGNWAPGQYTTIDLQGERLINSVTSIWPSPYGGNAFDIQYSTDGVNFYNAANAQAPLNYSPEHFVGATEVKFDPAIARYVRMLNASGGFSGFTIMNQMLIHSPVEGVLSADHAANSTISMMVPFGSLSGTLTDGITLENTGTAGSAIGIFSYTITGLNAAEFDLSNFAPTILMDGDQISFDIDFDAPTAGTYTALLTFNTSVGTFSVNLESSGAPAPEPASLVLLGVGALALMRRRKN